MNNPRQCDNNIDEVRDVFDVIERFSNQIKTPIIKNTHDWEQRIGGVFLVPLAVSLVTLVIAPEWLVYAGVVSLLAAFAYAIAQILSFGIFYNQPLSGYSKLASIRTHNRMDFVDYLASFSEESLNEVKRTIEKDFETIDKRIGFLIGVIDKTGLIPAAIALIFAIQQQGGILSGILYGTAIAMYATAILGKRAIEVMKSNAECIELALNLQKEEQ